MCRKLGYLGAKEGGSQEAIREACLEEGGLSWALHAGWVEWGRQAVGVTALGGGDGRAAPPEPGLCRTSGPHPRRARSRGFLGC